MNVRIGVAGNIGVGKSTLTGLLAKHLNAEPYYEKFQGNPYLDDFYRDMDRWAFHSQIYFLIQRVKEIQELALVKSDLILDRTIYEDAEIFATNLHRQGKINQRDFQTYFELYQTVSKLIRSPDLVIYLAASVETLVERIGRRGRENERKISPEYLDQLNLLYEKWSSKLTNITGILTIQTNNIELGDPDDRQTIFNFVSQAMASPAVAFQSGDFEYRPPKHELHSESVVQSISNFE